MAKLAPVYVERQMSELGENRVIEGDIGAGGVKQNAIAVEDDETKVVTRGNGGAKAHG